ncbi:MAG: hypothetical protein J6A04_06875 [Clostridia bacterium]|nr:hypothetical protein [Clostridia bacterium]
MSKTYEELKRDFYENQKTRRCSIYSGECYNNGDYDVDHYDDDDDADCFCD